MSVAPVPMSMGTAYSLYRHRHRQNTPTHEVKINKLIKKLMNNLDKNVVSRYVKGYSQL